MYCTSTYIYTRFKSTALHNNFLPYRIMWNIKYATKGWATKIGNTKSNTYILEVSNNIELMYIYNRLYSYAIYHNGEMSI